MDYFKKNRMLTLAIALITLSFLVYGFSHSIPMLITARLIHGWASACRRPELALVSNILPTGKMASGLGVFSLGSAVATAIGLSSVLNWRTSSDTTTPSLSVPP
jgi:predicted MFS family arabinose efflux permease